ncbi:hypothetical protein [Asaia bogorensis]|uniref:hypothetical protein n=1 Tax=Asaia bogorensis TaxID=91915 RepID=UPI00285634DF|nr:hypothetical protein [Asaia bogorensis]MDR6182060.1 hypothetical protein [Asaia bogorensis NBRC 16594]
MIGTRQYLRVCSLQVAGQSGSGIELSALRVTFHITHGTQQTPRVLQARVYNPSPSTIQAIEKQFTRVVLSAGYQGNAATIFSGTITQTRHGRENPVDTFIDIFASSNEQSYATATTQQVLAPGWQWKDVHSQAVTDMADDNIAAGAFPEISGSGARPKVMYGMTRDICRVAGTSTGSAWNVSDGALNFNQITAMQKGGGGKSIALTPKSGLVGIPVQVPGGVQATCLLNPDLQVGVNVTLNDSLVLGQQADLSYGATDGGNFEYTTDNGVTRRTVVGLSPTGSYSVVFVEHIGDTRGDPWYSTITCIATDVSAVQSRSLLGAF